jgi:DNA-binding NtrC family response regulator
VGLQAKLLRVLETGEFELVGSSKTRHVDVRVLSATNADVDREVAEGRFRQDLLYRLNTVTVRVPPLRDRREDIPILAAHFLRRHAARYRRPVTGFDSAALEVLVQYAWPGNVRELDHTIERAVLMGHAGTVQASDLGLETRSAGPQGRTDRTLEELERWAVQNALDRSGGDITKAAEALGLSRGALYRRLEKYSIGG